MNVNIYDQNESSNGSSFCLAFLAIYSVSNFEKSSVLLALEPDGLRMALSALSFLKCSSVPLSFFLLVLPSDLLSFAFGSFRSSLGSFD